MEQLFLFIYLLAQLRGLIYAVDVGGGGGGGGGGGRRRCSLANEISAFTTSFLPPSLILSGAIRRNIYLGKLCVCVAKPEIYLACVVVLLPPKQHERKLAVSFAVFS